MSDRVDTAEAFARLAAPVEAEQELAAFLHDAINDLGIMERIAVFLIAAGVKAAGQDTEAQAERNRLYRKRRADPRNPEWLQELAETFMDTYRGAGFTDKEAYEALTNRRTVTIPISDELGQTH